MGRSLCMYLVPNDGFGLIMLEFNGDAPCKTIAVRSPRKNSYAGRYLCLLLYIVNIALSLGQCSVWTP